MVRFAMSSNILTFQGKYYEYDGYVTVNKRVLTIGGYESTWLADLTMAFLLEQNMVKGYFNKTIINGIYRDDGFAIFNRRMKKKDVRKWLVSFQKALNIYATNNFLKFTATIW